MTTPAAPRQEVRDILEAPLHGNHPALDLVNTVDWRLAPERGDHVDLLRDVEVLLHWGRRMGLLSEDELGVAIRRSARSTEAFSRTVELREVLYSIFSAVARGAAPSLDDLAALRSVFAEALSHAELVPSPEGRLVWSWEASEPVDRVRWAVAASAVELLTSAELVRVKQCLHEGCGWVFLDLSKNASRRWCSMQGCGARAKMRRQYRRKKAQATTEHT